MEHESKKKNSEIRREPSTKPPQEYIQNSRNFCRKLHHPLLEMLCCHKLGIQRSLLHQLEASQSMEVRFCCQSESIRKEREICLLPASLAQQEEPNATETLGLVQPQPTIPTDLETFTNLNGFSQIYNDELEIPMNEQEPLLVLSQEEGKKVESEQDAMGNKVAVKELKCLGTVRRSIIAHLYYTCKIEKNKE